MDNLIPITESNGTTAVSARALYEFLGVTTDFTTWCKRMFDYGFTREFDFTPILGESSGGRPSIDYALTIDCAKEIAMIQRTDRGKQARQYFIEVEKRYKSMAPQSMTQAEALLASVQMMVQQERRLNAVESNQRRIEEKIDLIEAKQTTINEDYFALSGYYRLKQRNFDLTTAQAQQTGKALSRKSAELGYTVGKTYSDKFGNVNTYHRYILQAVLGF